ncbi:MAG TPA: hypothetical protein VD970_08580 [Acetobacteraceae bacterium]|nr:hypothetical protein [Acetobacteraceae bacterium]
MEREREAEARRQREERLARQRGARAAAGKPSRQTPSPAHDAVVAYVSAHPGCIRKTIVEALADTFPTACTDPRQRRAAIHQALTRLVQKGRLKESEWRFYVAKEVASAA